MAKSDLPKGVTKEKLKEYYRQMLFIRRFEEQCNRYYRQGKIGGYMHTYIGMEATAIGWLDALNVGEDYVITAYRDHAHPLLMGTDPVAVAAEIMGRAGGTCGGKGGSMHIYDAARRFYGGWGIVGGHTPLGAGLAFAAKYRKEDNIAVCFLGDGAANAGVFFEAMNMCGLWDLPIVFIIENNEFAMGTRLEYHAAVTELHTRGAPFDLKHERLDGMDVVQVREDAGRVVEDVRKNSQPYLLEIMNYRFEGHGAADNDRQLYRTKEEEKEAEQRDPLPRLEKILTSKKVMTKKAMEELQAEIKEETKEIWKKADESPYPDLDEVYTHVYSDMMPERGH